MVSAFSQTPCFSGLAMLLLLFTGASAQAANRFTLQMDSLRFSWSESVGTATGTLRLSNDGTAYHLSFDVEFDGEFDFSAYGGGGGSGPEQVTGMHFHREDDSGQLPVGGHAMGLIAPNDDKDGDTVYAPAGSGTRLTGEWDSGEGRHPPDREPFDLDDFVPALLAAGPGEFAGLYLVLHTDDYPGASIGGPILGDSPPIPALPGVGAWALGVALVASARVSRFSRGEGSRPPNGS